MAAPHGLNDDTCIAALDAAHKDIGSSHARLFDAIRAAELDEAWVNDGCRDFASWLAARLNVSTYKARRYIAVAHALP